LLEDHSLAAHISVATQRNGVGRVLKDSNL
jgi:hypothetical protein